MKAFKFALKVMLGILLIGILLVIIGYFALTRWINPNTFKPQIISMVKATTGRELILPGNISWTLYPEIGIHLGNAALSNPAGFNQPSFASIDSTDLFLSYNQLLHGKIDITHLAINGLQVNLISNGAQNNWQFPALAPSPQNTQSSKQNSLKFNLESVEFIDATVNYDDYLAKSHYTFTHLNLNIPDFNLNAPMNMKMSGFVSSDSINASFKFNTLFDTSKINTIALTNLGFSSDAIYTSDSNQSYPISLQASGNAVFNQNPEKLDLTDVYFMLDHLVSGKAMLSVKNFNHPAYMGNIVLSPFSLPNLLSAFNESMPNFPNKDQFNNTRLQTDISGTKTSLIMKNLQFGFGNTNITGTLSFNQFSPLLIHDDLNIDSFDLADFIDLSGARIVANQSNLKGVLSLTSADTGAFPESLNAVQRLGIKDIAVKGVELAAIIQNLDLVVNNITNIKNTKAAYQAVQSQLNTLQNKQALSLDVSNGKQSDLGSLKARVIVRHGVMNTPVMILSGPFADVSGMGKINFNQKNINYQLNAKITGSKSNLIKELMIPYTINGPFNNIQQGVAWDSVRTQALKYIGNQVTHILGNAISDVVLSPGLLSHLFGKDKPASS